MRIGHKKILLKEVATFLNGYAFINQVIGQKKDYQ